jgi:hypothetical protein
MGAITFCQWSRAARPGTLQFMSADAGVVVAACLVVDGSSVYLRPDETWTHDLHEAALYPWDEGESQVASRAWDGDPLVFGTGVVEAERRGGRLELYGTACGQRAPRIA